MMKKTTNDTNNKPAFEARLGNVSVSVWSNQSDDGKTWFNTSICRRYKDGAEWKQSSTFSNAVDLILLADAVRLARKYVEDHTDASSDNF